MYLLRLVLFMVVCVWMFSFFWVLLVVMRLVGVVFMGLVWIMCLILFLVLCWSGSIMIFVFWVVVVMVW